MDAGARAAFVTARCPLRPVPGLPRISLHLADDAFGLWEATEAEAGQADLPPPYWAFGWPGGVALARYLLDHHGLVAGRAVLDLGSGSGLTAIAAAQAGAAAVLASEIDPLAVTAIGLNAQANGVSVTVTGDVLDGTGEGADVVIAGDVWYASNLAERALGLLERARARGAEVLAADVGRRFLPRASMRGLASYEVPVSAELEGAAVRRAEILTLR